MHQALATRIVVRRPMRTRFSLWTVHGVRIPVDLQVRNVIALSLGSGPTGSTSYWPNQRNVMVHRAVHYQFRIDIPFIDAMCCW